VGHHLGAEWAENLTLLDRNRDLSGEQGQQNQRELCGFLVGAVGIALKATLKFRKLLILLNGKNITNIRFARPRYTPGTRLLELNVHLFVYHAIPRKVELSILERMAGTTRLELAASAVTAQRCDVID
jgi:hypothetical protein